MSIYAAAYIEVTVYVLHIHSSLRVSAPVISRIQVIENALIHKC